MLVKSTMELVAEEEPFSKRYEGLETVYCTPYYIIYLLRKLLRCSREKRRVCQILRQEVKQREN